MLQLQWIQEDKKRLLDLLLLADEQESMIDRYLDRGDLYALYDGNSDCVCGVCVVTKEQEGLYEIKNLAVRQQDQRKGYGSWMLNEIENKYRSICHTLIVGTGDSPLTLSFYQKCGFTISHRIKDFFIEHYDHPIIEGGVRLKDMVYLTKHLDDRKASTIDKPL